MPNNASNAEDQVIRLTVLSQIAVDPSLQPQALGIGNDFSGRDDRANGTEVVEGLGVAVLRAGHLGPLPVACGDVVADCVAEHVVEGVFVGAEVLHVFADDDGEFTFVV